MVCPCRKSYKRKRSYRKRKKSYRKKRKSIHKRTYPSSAEDDLRRSKAKKQKEDDIDAEDDRRTSRREKRIEEKNIDKFIGGIGAAAVITAGFYLLGRYNKTKRPPPFVIVKKNGVKGYYDKKNNWFPRPITLDEYNVWENYRKSNIKFIHDQFGFLFT